MKRDEFERLVAEAIEALPEEFLARLENIDITVEDAPTRSQLREQGISRDETLFGLYEGVPLTERGAHYGLVPPDKITIFQRPIENYCHTPNEIIAEVGDVVRHEIAHHFGLSDARLHQLEKRRRQTKADG